MGVTPVLIELARRRNWVDQPNARSVHKQPIARLGGVAIFFAAMLATLPVLFVPNAVGESFRDLGIKILALLTGASMMFALGLYDDLHGLRARYKLMIQLAAAVLVCACGIHIQSFTVQDLFTINFGVYGYLITILWIVGITNAVNIIDGLDGLSAGISAIACGVIAVMAVLHGNVVLAILMLALLGSLTGFLFFNFSPAKIFMGDCGSLYIGFSIATASVMTASKTYALAGIALPILVLGIPIFDTLFSMLRRFLQRRGMMSADRSHFHHRLLDLGFSQHHVAIIAYLVTLLLSGMGFFLLATRSTASIIVFLCSLLLLLLVFRIIGSVRLRETLAGIRKRRELASASSEEYKHFEEAQLHFMNAKTFDTWWDCVCLAGSKLNFAHLALLLTDREGNVRTLTWDNPEVDHKQVLIDVKVPVPDSRQETSLSLEVQIPHNGRCH
jgi:UDP-GlcNAc:undecaprenyl-phosphate GlcNAc-1-phosphate transferase